MVASAAVEGLRELLGGVAKRARLAGEERERRVHVAFSVEAADPVDHSCRETRLRELSSRGLAVLHDDRKGGRDIGLLLGAGWILAPTPAGHQGRNRQDACTSASRKLRTSAHHRAQYPVLGPALRDQGPEPMVVASLRPAPGTADAKVQSRLMGKIWVLDTETKGTGAEMVPLEKVLNRGEQPADRITVARGRRGRRRRRPPESRQPARF